MVMRGSASHVELFMARKLATIKRMDGYYEYRSDDRNSHISFFAFGKSVLTLNKTENCIVLE